MIRFHPIDHSVMRSWTTLILFLSLLLPFTDAVPIPCNICSNVSIPADQMEATFELHPYAFNSDCIAVDCVFEMAPLENHGLIVEFRDLEVDTDKGTKVILEEYVPGEQRETRVVRAHTTTFFKQAHSYPSSKGAGMRIKMLGVVAGREWKENPGRWSERTHTRRTAFQATVRRHNDDYVMCPPLHHSVDGSTNLTFEFGGALYWNPLDDVNALKNSMGCVVVLTTKDAGRIRVETTAPAHHKVVIKEHEKYYVDRHHDNSPKGPDENGVLSYFSTTNAVIVGIRSDEIFKTFSDYDRRYHGKGLYHQSKNATLSLRAETEDDPCTTFPSSLTLNLNETVALTSPGYGYYTCRSATLETQITADPSLLISTHYAPVKQPNLVILDEARNVLKRFENVICFRLGHNVPSMALPPSIILRYETTADEDFGQQFNISFTAVEQQKVGDGDAGNFSLSVPKHCSRLDCFAFIRAQTEQEILTVSISKEWSLHVRNEDEFLSLRSDDGNVAFHTVDRQKTETSETKFGSTLDPSSRTRPTNITLHYHRDKPSNRNTTVLVKYEWKKYCDCGAVDFIHVNASHHESLKSPNYPAAYCMYANCKYVIAAPDGHSIQMRVHYFNTKANVDFVKLFDGAGSREKRLGRLTGVHEASKFGESQEFKTNRLIVEFTSNAAAAGKEHGYWLDFESVAPVSPNTTFIQHVNHAESTHSPLTWIFAIAFLLCALLLAFIAGAKWGHVLKSQSYSALSPRSASSSVQFSTLSDTM